MKKNNILFRCSLAFGTLMLLALTCVGCQKDDDGAVVLQSFGPSPVLRGNEIRFIGQNLDKVTKVIFPSEVEVTEITVVNPSQIKVVVPQAAVEGKVTLVYGGGQVTSTSSIGFLEPFAITSIAPVGTMIRAGGEVTIEGDYLNTVARVVFAGDAEVAKEDFLTQSRARITLELPAAAVSGKLYVADANDNLLYSDDELTVQQPTISSVTTTPKKPAQTITITGTDLDLIGSVVFTGGAEVEATDFDNQSATGISVAIPDDAQDGTITAVAYSGQRIESTDEITIVVPSGLSVAAATRFKAGLAIEITGSDIDLVTRLKFSGMDEDTEFTYASNKITAIIPAKAIDGTVELGTAAKKTVATPEITLVKAAITSFAPASITAGESFTVTGTDLDLVTSSKVNGGSCVIGATRSETELTIETPLNATGGTIELTAANGDKALSADRIVIEPSTKPTVTAMPASAMPGDEITLTGTNLNYVDAVYFGTVKVKLYSVRTATELTFTIPATAPLGSTKIKLVTIDDEEVMTDDAISLSGQEPIVDQSLVIMDYEAHGDHDGSWDGPWGVVSDELKDDNTNYTRLTGIATATTWIMNCNHHDSGAPGPSIADAADYVLKIDIKIEQDIDVVDSDAMSVVLGGKWIWINSFFPTSSDGAKYSTGGEWMTLTFDLGSLTSGALNCGIEDNGLFWQGSVPFDLTGVCLDNLRFQAK